MNSRNPLFQCLTHVSPCPPCLTKVPTNILGKGLLNNWIDGLLILTKDGRYVDGNRLGRHICDRITRETSSNGSIPDEIWQTCQILIQRCRRYPQYTHTAESELRLKPSQSHFRIRVQWFDIGQAEPHILVVLENQTVSRQNLATTEAIRYALSPREADVWELHRLGYTYREIAQTLHIALNTVKKHVKNTYAKQNVVALVDENCRNNLAS